MKGHDIPLMAHDRKAVPGLNHIHADTLVPKKRRNDNGLIKAIGQIVQGFCNEVLYGIVNRNSRGDHEDSRSESVLTAFFGLFNPAGMLQGSQNPIYSRLMQGKGPADFRKGQGFPTLGRIKFKNPDCMQYRIDIRGRRLIHHEQAPFQINHDFSSL